MTILLSQLQPLLILSLVTGPSIQAGRRRFRVRGDDSFQSD